MTVQRSFKRIVRARMEKTGESYTAARAALLAADDAAPSKGPSLSVSDAVITERTGRGWEDWFDRLDDAGATQMTRTEMLEWAAAEHGLEGWSANAVTVNYQRARNLRAVGEHPDGFTVSASKTIAVPVERLFEAFTTSRDRWHLTERTVLPPRTARFDYNGGGSRLVAFFQPKGEERSTITVQHERLADGEEAERMKAYWREQVGALKEELER